MLSLQEKKYILRRGDRAVVYWDVFRDFLNTGVAPVVPISYLPSVSVSSAISVGCALNKTHGTAHAEIAQAVELSEGTVGNVIRDLRMFGVASGSWGEPELSSNLEEGSPESIARQIREVFFRHAICDELIRIGSGRAIPNDEYLRVVGASPTIKSRSGASVNQTANRLSSWLSTAGFLKGIGPKWAFEDYGSIDLSFASRKRRQLGAFNGSAPPHRALEVLRKVMESGFLTAEQLRHPGYEKALNVLSRFELIVEFENSSIKPVGEALSKDADLALELLLRAAERQESVAETVSYLKENPNSDGVLLATHLAGKFDEDWAEGSLKRTGNALRRWGSWLIDCEEAGGMVEPEEGSRGKRPQGTPEMMKTIFALKSSGMTKVEIAKTLGKSVGAISNWLAKHS